MTENSFREIFMLAAKYFYKEFKRSGGSQERMAQELGVTKTYISAVMNGSRNASLSLLEHIALMLSSRPLDEFLRIGRRIKNGLPPIQEEKALSDSPEELISKLTYYIVNHHHIEKELEEGQWLFQEAINLANYGIVIVSADRKVLTYNKAYQIMFGYPEEILAIKDIRALISYIHPQMANLEEFEKDLEEAFAATTPISHHVVLKDGRTIKRDVFPLVRDDEISGRVAHLTELP